MYRSYKYRLFRSVNANEYSTLSTNNIFNPPSVEIVALGFSHFYVKISTYENYRFEASKFEFDPQ